MWLCGAGRVAAFCDASRVFHAPRLSHACAVARPRRGAGARVRRASPSTLSKWSQAVSYENVRFLDDTSHVPASRLRKWLLRTSAPSRSSTAAVGLAGLRGSAAIAARRPGRWATRGPCEPQYVYRCTHCYRKRQGGRSDQGSAAGAREGCSRVAARARGGRDVEAQLAGGFAIRRDRARDARARRRQSLPVDVRMSVLSFSASHRGMTPPSHSLVLFRSRLWHAPGTFRRFRVPLSPAGRGPSGVVVA